jgi:hypothetical protein
MRYEIQDEINMMTMKTVEDAYQVALKAEEKLTRKQSQRNRGKSPNRGRGIVREKFQYPRVEAGKYHNQTKRGGSSRGHYVEETLFPEEEEEAEEEK